MIVCFRLNSEKLCGYKQISNFFSDLSFAEMKGKDEIIYTYQKIFEKYKNQYEYLTELVLVLRWKIYLWQSEDIRLARLYKKLWHRTHRYACKHLKRTERIYYFATIN